MGNLERYVEWMDSLEVQLVDFHGREGFNPIERDFKPYRPHLHIDDGIYLTMRCGLGGIYTCINTVKDNKWEVESLDNSTTIAYRPLRDEEKFEEKEYGREDNQTKKEAEV